MKKKILAIVLCVAMLAIAIVGGTMAYFTDTDAKTNVMVSGNVDITQNEKDRYGNDFVDNQKLVPAVYNGTLAYDGTDYQGGKIWDKTVNNEIDKIITVTNNGSEPAYIRTIVLFENTADNAICAKIHGLWADNDGQYRQWLVNEDGSDVIVEIDGVKYSVAVCQYNTALEAGATSTPSLKQIFVDPSATNEWSALLGADYKFNILALSQAVQAQGFEAVGAKAALDEAFGEVTAANVVTWFTAE